MDPQIIALYDAFTHAAIDRRSFLNRLTALAGSSAAATALLPLLVNHYALAATVDPADPRLAAGPGELEGMTGKLACYQARPAGSDFGGRPTVVVIHENRGLNAHIEDVARRLALAGWNAVAPDFLSPLGGTPADEDQARELIGKLDPDQTVQNAVAVVDHFAAAAKVGAVGFCWGGGLAGRLAAAAPRLTAAVVYYGLPPDPASVPGIRAALLLHYAGLDERINAAVPVFEIALTAAKVDYALYRYAGVQHAFNNDTNSTRYDKAAADLAWQRTLDFLAAKLA